MSWSYSRAQVEEYLAATCSDTELSARLKSTPMPDQFYWPDKTMGHSRLSRFGMTCEPLTESLGEELLTWYLAAFPVRTYQQPEKAQELPEQEAGYGVSSQELLARFNPVSCSWKIPQCSLFEDLEQSLEIWPRWGLMRNGACYQQPMLVLRTCEKESGFWPTPLAMDTKKDSPSERKRDTPHLESVVKMAMERFATPTTMDALPPKSEQALLMEATIARPNRSKPANLRDQVSNMQNWPTPTSCMHKGSSEAAKTRKDGKDRTNDRLDHKIENGDGRLNPMWVEWLMGWPIGQTDLKPLETDKFREFEQQHGIYFTRESHVQDD